MTIARSSQSKGLRPAELSRADGTPFSLGSLSQALRLMSFRRKRSATTVADCDLEKVRVFYAALGPGFPASAQSIFGNDEANEGVDGANAADEWCVFHGGRPVRSLSATDLTNDELFAMPTDWELTRVHVRRLRGEVTRRGDHVTVEGHYCCRPHSSWDGVSYPFVHQWTLHAGRALRFENFLGSRELRRMKPLEREV